MPRKRATAIIEDDGLAQDALELDPDPTPTAARRGVRSRLTAAKSTPARGPGRPRKAGPRAPSGRIMSKAQMVSQVQTEVTMYLEIMAGGWELRDPECAAEATSERLSVIADRLTAMIARSDSLLAMATKTGIIGDIVALLHAVKPIATAVWKAHGPSGHGHGAIEELAYDQYPPYATAAN